MNKNELRLILEEGEGYKIEFKESLANIDREIVAFANSSGGRIFLGITDNKEIQDIAITNKLKSQMQDIANNCQPEDFGKKSVLRNPNIANLLNRIEYIEKMGTGISKIKRLIKSAGLPAAKFEFNTFFTATFGRPKAKKEKPIPQSGAEKFGIKFGIKGSRLKRMTDILNALLNEKTFSVADFSGRNRVTSRVIEKDLEFLKVQGIIEFHGARKTGRYVITGEGRKLMK